MIAVFRIIAFVILAAWLPVTQHCAMAAAGVIAPEVGHVETADCADSAHCGTDGCDTVEAKLTSPAPNIAKVSMPENALAPSLLVFCLTVLSLQSINEPTLSVETTERPLDWVPEWQFVRRAAPLSRAPSFLC